MCAHAETLAAAWHGGLAGADQFVQNADVLSTAQRAMDWWFANDFTKPDCLINGGKGKCPCGTPGLWNPNWFSNVSCFPSTPLMSFGLSARSHIAMRADYRRAGTHRRLLPPARERAHRRAARELHTHPTTLLRYLRFGPELPRGREHPRYRQDRHHLGAPHERRLTRF